MLEFNHGSVVIITILAGVYCMAGVILSKGEEQRTLAQLEKEGVVKEVVKSKVHLCADTKWKEQLEL